MDAFDQNVQSQIEENRQTLHEAVEEPAPAAEPVAEPIA